MRAPKGYFGKKQSHMPRQGAVVVEKKQDGWVSKPFDAAAQGLYKGYAYGKGQYLTAKKKRQAITDKWKKQIDTEKQKWKHSILQALWPQNKKDDETEDVMTEEIAEIENEPIEENKKE